MPKKYSLFVHIFSVFILIGFSAITFYLSYDRYVNYVFGKFDLGNMNQMLFNSSRLNFMVLTDYFGSNNIRWSMSHIDPLILILIPFNLFYSDASLLLLSQNIAFLISAFLIYKISRLYKLSIVNSWLISFLIYLMPISGYILVWTTFHPSSLALPIYFLIYYLFLLDREKKIKKNFLQKHFSVLVFVLAFLFVLGKEELGIVLASSVPFLISEFKLKKSLILKIGIMGAVWSAICLFILIPSYSNARNSSMNQFLKDAKINVDLDKYSNANYFLYRYSALGDSYGEIATSVVLNPESFINILINKHNLDTLNKLLLPNLYTIVINPYLLIAFVPETLIQMLSADPEVFSITNHRLLVVLPFLILSIILFSAFLQKRLNRYSSLFLVLLVFLNIYLSFNFKSPFIYPVTDKVIKFTSLRDYSKVYADSKNVKVEFQNDLSQECVSYLISQLLPEDKVSVPQPLGAVTSNRSYNALFPTGTKQANVIISDIYDRKIVDFLDLPETINKKIVKRSLEDDKFSLVDSCNRFFLFRKNSTQSDLGTLEVIPTNNFVKKEENRLIKSSYYDSAEITIDNQFINFKYKYFVGDESSRNALFAYTTITNGVDWWQFVHLPSYYLHPINDVPVNSLVEEKFKLTIPKYLHKGKYSVYFGIGDKKENNNNLKVAEIEL